MVAARTAPDGHRGITTFIVEAGTPGLSLGPPLRKMGWHASDTREVVLADCLVPPEAVLGEPNRGFHQIMSAFQLERLTLAAMGVGHARGVPGAGDRVRPRPRGVRLAADQPAGDQAPARRPVRRARGGPRAHLPGGGPPGQRPPGDGRSVAMAKYHAAIAANRIIDECVQIFGGAGFLEETAGRPCTTGTPGCCASAAAPTRSSSRSWPRTCRRDRAADPRAPAGAEAVRAAIAAARRGNDASRWPDKLPVRRPARPPCSTRAAGGRTGCSPTPGADGLPADGVRTGVGRIEGRAVAVIAHDFAVKAGSWGKLTCEKQVRILERADRDLLPVIYLVDSAGGRLTDQLGFFSDHRGASRIFHLQVALSGRVPQICCLLGPSAAGGAYMPAFTDWVGMVEGNASMYLASPAGRREGHRGADHPGGDGRRAHARHRVRLRGRGVRLGLGGHRRGPAAALLPARQRERPARPPPAPVGPGSRRLARRVIPADPNAAYDVR